MSKIARPGSEGNMRLLKAYGGGSAPPRQSYADGGAVNPSMDEGMSAASGTGNKPEKDGKPKKDAKDSKININVIVADKDKTAVPPVPPPTGAAGLTPPPPMPMLPPGPALGVPLGQGPGLPGALPMRAKGGRVTQATFAKNVAEPKATNDKGKSAKKPVFDPPAPMAMPKGNGANPGKPYATGGPVKAPTESGMVADKGYQGGGGGAVGRMEKARKYGK